MYIRVLRFENFGFRNLCSRMSYGVSRCGIYVVPLLFCVNRYSLYNQMFALLMPLFRLHRLRKGSFWRPEGAF